MIALAEWFKKPDSEKVLLVEVDPASTALYMADTFYVTEPADTPANQPYSPVIAQDGIPRLARKIQEVWGGRSMPSWGSLELATDIVGASNLSEMNLRGLPVNVYITGPRSKVDHADAVKILTGHIGARSGNVDGGLSIEILDEQANWNDITLLPNQYDGTESAAFPASNIGMSKPIALGYCRNVPGVLIDQSNWTYQFHDGSVASMQGINAIYDNGVSVAFTNVDLAAGTAQLSNPPSGVITADVQGVHDGINYLTSTQQVITWLATEFGGLGPAEIDISGLPADTIGFYLQGNLRLADVITQLMQGVLGWWGFNRQGDLVARIFPAPSGGGVTFDDRQHLSDVTWEDEADIFWSIPFTYRNNWQQLEPAASVATDYATWLRGNSYQVRSENSDIKTSYSFATTSKVVRTFFDDAAAAQAVGERALALFGTARRRGKVTLPITDPMLELGGELSLSDAGVMTGDYIIIGLSDIWDGEVPMVDVEVWG